MIIDRINYAIESTLEAQPNLEQKFLIEFTGRKFPAADAITLWRKVIEHKWYVSERLQRDIGLKVAAVDYLENIYQPNAAERKEKVTLKSAITKLVRRLSDFIPPPLASEKSIWLVS